MTTSTRVQLSSLQIGKRHRAIDKHKVASLAKSMEVIGLQQPISVFQNGDVVHLVVGLHRVMAAKSLGWEHIDGIAVELDEIGRELWEIDENLQRAGLSKAEERAHFKRRKELWEKRRQEVSAHDAPKPKSGPKGGRPKSSFAADTAAATGRSKSQINRIIAEPKPKKLKAEKPVVTEPDIDLTIPEGLDRKRQKEKPASGFVDCLGHPVWGPPLNHEPKLETHTGIDAALRCYLGQVEELGVDIEVEIERVTKALREIASKRHPKTNGAKEVVGLSRGAAELKHDHQHHGDHQHQGRENESD